MWVVAGAAQQVCKSCVVGTQVNDPRNCRTLAKFGLASDDVIQLITQVNTLLQNGSLTISKPFGGQKRAPKVKPVSDASSAVSSPGTKKKRDASPAQAKASASKKGDKRKKTTKAAKSSTGGTTQALVCLLDLCVCVLGSKLVMMAAQNTTLLMQNRAKNCLGLNLIQILFSVRDQSFLTKKLQNILQGLVCPLSRQLRQPALKQ